MTSWHWWAGLGVAWLAGVFWNFGCLNRSNSPQSSPIWAGSSFKSIIIFNPIIMSTLLSINAVQFILFWVWVWLQLLEIDGFQMEFNEVYIILRWEQSGMQLAIEEILKKEQQQIDHINDQLKSRAEKFGSQFVPITLSDYKLYKIQKASETGKMQYLEGILLEDIQDIQERRRRIKQRTQKFFPSVKVEADPNKFFNPRSNPDFTEDNTSIRYNTWYLFGVDYMSNERIRNYFHTNPHFKIQWINDSSCNISFNTKEEAEEAIKPYIKGDSMTDEKQEIWYELNEYEVEGVKRKLFCRLATNKDQKPQGLHGHDSKYYRWELNKKHINKFVKSKATQYINKEKKIKKQHVVKKEIKKQQEKDSSSGLDDSSQEQEMKQ